MSILSESSRKRTVFLWVSALALVALLVATRHILLPFVLALVIAYVLTPAVSQVERLRVPRWVAVLIVYAVTLSAIYGFLALVTPRLAREISGLRAELPRLSERVRDVYSPAVRNRLRSSGLLTTDGPEELGPALEPPSTFKLSPNADGSYNIQLSTEVEVHQSDTHTWRVSPVTDGAARGFDITRIVTQSIESAIAYGRRNTMEVLRLGSAIVGGLSRAIFTFFLTLMLAAYVMLTREKLLAFFTVLVKPSNRASFGLLLARIDRGLAGVVRGQLLICLVNGVLTAIGFSIMGLKYWPILSLIAGVMSIIPIFGSILSSIPAVAIGLTQGLGMGLLALGWIVGIHQVEANLLNPKIYGIAAKIHPVLVIFALLVGEHFFGLPGALLAVPTMSIAQNVFLHFRAIALGADAPVDTFVSGK